jgi:hypothetical protein
MNLEVIAGGTATSIYDGTLCWLEATDGTGMAPLHRFGQRGPMQHGETDVGYRLDARQIKLVLGYDGATLDDMYRKRAALLALFRPRIAPLALRWTLDNGAVRQIDVHYTGDMSMPRQAGDGFSGRIGVTLSAPDPTFYDPAGQALTFNMGAGGNLFVVPSSVPSAVGASTIDTTRTISYDGTWLTYPSVVRIVGPITSPVIRNEATGEKLDFAGVALGVGDVYTVDCRWGKKTVMNQAGINKIADLTPDSNLATFHIAAEDEAPGGFNTLRVSGSGCNTTSRVDVVYLVRYVGI